MPAQRLHHPADVRRFDVVGQDSQGVADFVCHLALSSEQRDRLRSHEAISLTHMGPPLQHGSKRGPVQVIGTVPLTADEIQQISVFVDELLSEYEAHNARGRGQYVVRPHVAEKRDSDGTVLYRRFNCAGFVIEAYREAGINLIETEDEKIPASSLQTLQHAYPHLAKYLHDISWREQEDINLPGEGPWPVVLPGYVLNALARQENVIRDEPYQAAQGDEYYPTRRQDAAPEPLPR